MPQGHKEDASHVGLGHTRLEKACHAVCHAKLIKRPPFLVLYLATNAAAKARQLQCVDVDVQLYLPYSFISSSSNSIYR
jgi:hypothetical protein